MTLQEIKDNLFEYIKKQYDLADDSDYTPDINLFDYGYLDSLGAVEVITWLEETYKIEITQKDIVLFPMNSVDEIAEVVFRKVS